MQIQKPHEAGRNHDTVQYDDGFLFGPENLVIKQFNSILVLSTLRKKRRRRSKKKRRRRRRREKEKEEKKEHS